jgi:hypothetical protein
MRAQRMRRLMILRRKGYRRSEVIRTGYTWYKKKKCWYTRFN